MRMSAKFPQFMESAHWFQLPSETRWHLPDVLMFGGGLAIFYGVLAIGQTWFGPLTARVEISRSAWSLPMYAGYSLLRMGVAYALSLAFTLVYGYVAAHNPKAERFMIPLLDVLQSIPVLSFLPGVMLAMVALFPRHQIGVELGSILLIFTGQVWNMAFSFYASGTAQPGDNFADERTAVSSLCESPRRSRKLARLAPVEGLADKDLVHSRFGLALLRGRSGSYDFGRIKSPRTLTTTGWQRRDIPAG